MTPIAQLIAELERMLDNVVEDVDRKGNSRGFLFGPEQYQFIERTAERAAEALARQEELLAEAENRCDRLCDSNYVAGMKAGWNFCVDDNHAGYQRVVDARIAERAAARLSEKLKGE
jgi:glycogen synthase